MKISPVKRNTKDIGLKDHSAWSSLRRARSIQANRLVVPPVDVPPHMVIPVMPDPVRGDRIGGTRAGVAFGTRAARNPFVTAARTTVAVAGQALPQAAMPARNAAMLLMIG